MVHTSLIKIQEIFWCTEAIPRFVNRIPASLETIVERQVGNTKLIAHLSCHISIVICGIAILNYHEYILTTVLIQYLEIRKEVILNVI